jgi:hypothetical protein
MTNEQKQYDVMVPTRPYASPPLNADRDEVRDAVLLYTVKDHCRTGAKVVLAMHTGGVVRARIIAVLGSMLHCEHGIRIDVGEVASVTRVKR